MKAPNITLPTGAKHIINRLAKAGYKSYVVGGCVRDSLVGLTPKDWDICTMATPSQMMEVFTQEKIIETGLKHGTLTILLDGNSYELTTFRVEGDYSDGRRPDSVAFTDNLTTDLSRRDFTMNAMAYNDEDGLVDPFGGWDDLLRKELVTVGEARDRFQEDALRMLRAIRFSSTYGYHIAPAVAEAIHHHVALLHHVSQERIRDELVKILCGDHALGLLLAYPDVFTTMIPELAPCIGFEQNHPYHTHTVYDHMMYALSHYNHGDPLVKVALFLHDIGKPLCYTVDETGGHFYGHSGRSKEIAERVLSNLRFDRASIDQISQLIGYHDVDLKPTDISVKRWLNRLGERQLLRLVDIRMADSLAHAPGTQEGVAEQCQQVRGRIAEVLSAQQCFSQRDLAVTGHDILASGVEEGRAVGRILEALLQAVIEEQVENNREALLSMVHRLQLSLSMETP